MQWFSSIVCVFTFNKQNIWNKKLQKRVKYQNIIIDVIGIDFSKKQHFCKIMSVNWMIDKLFWKGNERTVFGGVYKIQILISIWKRVFWKNYKTFLWRLPIDHCIKNKKIIFKNPYYFNIHNNFFFLFYLCDS